MGALGVIGEGHGGRGVSLALKRLGVEHLFTLSGGHIFPIYDGCKTDGIRIVDVRHEQNAAFAAEGWARLKRTIGVAAVTAGPGVTNCASALAQASFNRAPVLALAGRAPMFRWGQGSLQEIDHVPFVDPLASANTVTDTAAIPEALLGAAHSALTPPRGPRFLDFPLDVLFNVASFDVSEPARVEAVPPDDQVVEVVAGLIDHSQRPVIVAGSGVWADGAERALLDLLDKVEIPVFMNGQGRGCVPADHRLGFARSRSAALKRADLVIVAGAPLDFRLNFGQGFASGARVVHLDSGRTAEHVALDAAIAASLDLTFTAIAAAVGGVVDTKEWVEELRRVEDAKRDEAQAELRLSSKPIHPMRVYGELSRILDRDAVVIGDGGDFVSYAGREIASYAPGRWLDPGPFGCLGCGPGYALAARLADPGAQVLLLLGDGAIGFSGVELESFVRHRLPVVCVVGNNGIWGLEKHPMKAMYGYDVAADLQPGLRYDQMMQAFGGGGELVEDPDDLGPALRRAFDSGEPTLVNVLTDPAVAYPRSSNLA